MNLEKLRNIFTNNGCEKVYVKTLAPNDNSKNQVYLGGNFEVLNIFPLSGIFSDKTGIRNTETFKATISFAWITEDGNLSIAPNAKFILYPEYPEVRFSGFLQGCLEAPSDLMTSRDPGRVLFMGISSQGTTMGFVDSSSSRTVREFRNESNITESGALKVWHLTSVSDNKQLLITELRKIHKLGWMDSIRLDGNGQVLDCNSPNCGGYTLEAKLGITPNGYSEPDFHGWEVKQYGVDNFDKLQSATITLMTPEPTSGLYVSDGVESFIRKYGYPDKKGRADRMNFGGVHKSGLLHSTTNLTLTLIGFNETSGKITSSNGRIALIDKKGVEAASWSFASLLKHWNRKHNLACYVPSKCITIPSRKYCYGNTLLMGDTTDFCLFLNELSIGNIYYDPGIKMEKISAKKYIKRRSQFRIKSRHLASLYRTNETIILK